MKLRYFIYSICLAGVALTSCQKEDELGNVVDTSSPYVLDYLADSTDEIDQRRYQIFQTYGVPVFLNDVVTEEIVGTDYKGDPIYKRETLDISWDFYSDPNTSYNFTYLITEDTDDEIDESLSEEEKAALEEQKAQQKAKELANAHLALDYVETYLSMAGNTKPFSILLLKKLVYDGSEREFYNGFRTLYIGKACNYPDAADMRMKSGEIINASVLPMIEKNEELVAKFEEVSEEKHYYNKQWKRDLGETFSQDLTSFINSPFYFKLSQAYDEASLKTLANNQNMQMAKMYYDYGYGDYSSMFGLPSINFVLKYCGNLDAMKEMAMEMVAIAAKYGFIGGGWSSEMVYSPTTSKDVEAYVKAALQLGAGGFEERYGQYPLVMQKFNIMKDYIENELGVSLDYNNVK